MKTRHATLIRKGILAARDPELRQYVHLAPRLVREAARRELDRAYWQAELARLRAKRQEWMLAAINSDNPEQVRRFHV
jgi:hypothetical protein